MTLKTTTPNLGSGKAVFVHCPNCSKMFPMTDDDERVVGPPASCTRCGCPIEESAKSRAFMNGLAEKEHDPALAALGRASRGEEIATDDE